MLSKCKAILIGIKYLESQNFKIVEQKVDDYHFRKLYIRMVGNTAQLIAKDFKGLNRESNKYICQCHWSTLEYVES